MLSPVAREFRPTPGSTGPPVRGDSPASVPASSYSTNPITTPASTGKSYSGSRGYKTGATTSAKSSRDTIDPQLMIAGQQQYMPVADYSHVMHYGSTDMDLLQMQMQMAAIDPSTGAALADVSGYLQTYGVYDPTSTYGYAVQNDGTTWYPEPIADATYTQSGTTYYGSNQSYYSNAVAGMPIISGVTGSTSAGIVPMYMDVAGTQYPSAGASAYHHEAGTDAT